MLTNFRLNKKKNWNKVYVDKAESLKESNQTHKEKYSNVDDVDKISSFDKATDFILEIFDRRKKHDQEFLGRAMFGTTLDNLIPPKEFSHWSLSWGQQVSCYICGLPGISDCKVCDICDVIAHKQCISYEIFQNKSEDTSNVDSINDVKTDTCFNKNKTFVCDNCSESKEIEINYYNKVRNKLLEERIKERSAQKIAKLFMISIERKYLAKKKKSILLIQSRTRGFLVYKKYKKLLRAKMKLLIIEITRLPFYLMKEHDVVLLTVFDTFKHVQTLRIDKTAEESMKEGFLIPGISANMLIVINLAHMNESVDGRRLYSLYAQAQLSLKDITEFSRKQVIALNFTEKIKWQPMEANFDYKYQLVSNSHSSSSSSDNALYTQINTLSSTNTNNNTNNNNNNSSSSNNKNTSYYLTADRECVLNYLPQNPVLTIVGLVQGPPLDILKRPPDTSIKKHIKVANNAATNSNYRNSRYWLCFYRLHLLLFQYYGDLTPRFVSDVSAAMAVLVRDSKGRKTSYVNIIHSDSRIWMIEFKTIPEALKFEFALNESRKAIISENGSIFGTKHSLILNEFHFGFNIQNIY